MRRLIITGLSQVIWVIGFGNSCSHALLAKRPSKMLASERNMISMPLAGACDGGMFAARALTALGAKVVPAMKPSCSDLRQKASKSRALVLLLPVLVHNL